MNLEREQADGSADGDTAPRGTRGAVSRLSRGRLTLARRQPARREPVRGTVASVGVSSQQLPVARELLVRWERRLDPPILWLSGALDRATATVLDRELNERGSSTARLLVDLTGLEFIDADGMGSLVRAHRRACDVGGRLSFRRGLHVARWPLGLVRTLQLRSERAARSVDVSDDHFYFALAMACADFDHPRPGDRTGVP